jgi:glycosyltransferase involved in cell wall biosynthesis
MVKTRKGWLDLQDIGTIVEAIPLILKKYPQTKLILLGIGNNQAIVKLIDRLQLQKNIILGNKFMFWGEEHLSTLALADCLCLPSIDILATRYFCKYKVLDYMLAKKPIISAETPGLKETFNDAALYYKPSNTESFAEQVINCFEHPQEMLDKAEKAYQLLTREHIWDSEINKFVVFMQSKLKS